MTNKTNNSYSYREHDREIVEDKIKAVTELVETLKGNYEELQLKFKEATDQNVLRSLGVSGASIASVRNLVMEVNSDTTMIGNSLKNIDLSLQYLHIAL